jgi:antitoxin component of MazEF toxin-antitoxin module
MLHELTNELCMKRCQQLKIPNNLAFDLQVSRGENISRDKLNNKHLMTKNNLHKYTDFVFC